mmetsp:Transcript_50617/g.118785  ORF Transcript_50617/g.118785 Transcript_50617/m.118785 type:complete len:318 (-) Transcript_50617:36-989(-)
MPSRVSELPVTAVSELLDAPPGLTKQSCEFKVALTEACKPPTGRPAAHSEADTMSTASGGEDVLDHDLPCDNYVDHNSHSYSTEGVLQQPFADPYANCWQRMTVPLSEHFVGLLSSRRGKQRLSALQKESGAHAQFDLNWRALHLRGTHQAILNAMVLMELMEGFTVNLPMPLWTELLRGRNRGFDEAPLSLTRVQEFLGRRIHVERESFELRIFAPLAERVATIGKVQLLASLCTKQTVELPADCDWNIIKELQASEKVTMKLEGSRVELIGVVSAVQQAAEDLKRGARPEEPRPTFLRAPPGLTHPGEAQQWLAI